MAAATTTAKCGHCVHFRKGKPEQQVTTPWPKRMGHCVGAHPCAEIHPLERACTSYQEMPASRAGER